MVLSTRNLYLSLVVLLIAGALAAFGISRATAQNEAPNSTPSASEAAVTDDSEFQATQRKRLWAVVKADGTLARGVGVRDVNRLVTGRYEVIFNRNVRQCVYTATIGLPDASGVAAPGEITTASRFRALNGVFIQTTNSSGAQANRSFHLLVNCT